MLTAWIDTAQSSASRVSRLARLQTSARGPATDTRLRVAVADCDERVLEDYQGLLKVLGHDAISLSQTGEDLLADFHAHSPDLVIIEEQLPDADGLEAAAEILRHRLIPIVLVTSSRDADLIQRARRNGVQTTVSKPFRLPELRAAIAHSRQCFDRLNAVGRKRTQPSLA